MYNLATFTRSDMYECAVALRNMDSGSTSLETTANRMVRYLYEHLIDEQTGKPACALVRFFQILPYGELDEELKMVAREAGGPELFSRTKCLTLLATAGDQPLWNSRYTSGGHKAIPLVSKEFVYQAPMILQLIQQFGLEVEWVVSPTSDIVLDLSRRTFNVFYIPEALASQHIPAQREFVVPYKIRSVVGFGGVLPSGNLFAMILFTKTWISRETADLFRGIAAYVRIAAAAFDQRAIFADSTKIRFPVGQASLSE